MACEPGGIVCGHRTGGNRTWWPRRARVRFIFGNIGTGCGVPERFNISVFLRRINDLAGILMENNKGGVSNERIGADHEGQRVDNFLSSRLKGIPRSLVYRLIRTGQVRINGKRCKPSARLHEGDMLRIPPVPRSGSGPVQVPDRVVERLRDAILHRDENLLVLNKPSGMAVHAGSGLAWGVIDGLRQLFPGEYLELAHRLDRETSGCLVFARNAPALKRIASQFREGLIDKRYLCLLDGRLPEDLVEVNAPLRRVATGQGRPVIVDPDGKPATTRFRKLQDYARASYVEAELMTGRTHQIRVHAQHIGLPLAGDSAYAPRDSRSRWRKMGLKRLFLHAHALELEDLSGQAQTYNAPLPEDLRSLLVSLEA